MVQLDAQAQRHLEGYLEQVRIHLGGCRTLDPAEVERDVRQHIERELQEVPKPVSFNDLSAVLERLGSPDQWVPDEEVPWWRKIITRLRSGPEDWRLAYLSFGLLMVGLLSRPTFISFLFVFVPASAIVSRAALSLAGDDRELRAQRWLIYPSLVILYLFMGFWLLFGPTLGLIGLADGCENSNTIDVFPWSSHDGLAYWPIAFMFVIAGTGLWWLILGWVHKRWPGLFSAIFRPFVQGLRTRWVSSFMGVAAALLAICLIAGILMIRNPVWYETLKKWGG